jgi:hypothetical protein
VTTLHFKVFMEKDVMSPHSSTLMLALLNATYIPHPFPKKNALKDKIIKGFKCNKSWDRSVQLRAGRPGFYTWQEEKICTYSTASNSAVGPTQPPIQWALEVRSPGVNWPGR